MNEQNFQYLKDNIKYLGAGDGMDEALLNKMKEGSPAFSLNYKTEIGRKPFEVNFHFRKSDSTDLYFLNGYSASLQRGSGEKLEHTFRLDNGKGITAKEAYNLLDGRAVFKELSNRAGEKYHAWLQMDFGSRDKHNNYEVKQYHEAYGYDLKNAVSQFAVSELKDPEKEKALMRSLQKGNLQSVTIDKEGFVHKMFIEANPQYKTVNLYDASLKRVQKENMAMYQSGETPTKQGQNLRRVHAKDNTENLDNKLDGARPAKGRSVKKSTGI